MKHDAKSSFTVILILFKSFDKQLKAYLQAQKENQIRYYGLLRNEQVDEIELEPIEETGQAEESYDKGRHIKEYCEINNVRKANGMNILQGKYDDIGFENQDEIIYENAYGVGSSRRIGELMPKRNVKLLSEIGEIPEEESSLKDSIRMGTIQKNEFDKKLPAMNRFSTQLSAQALSQSHSRANSQLLNHETNTLGDESGTRL